MAAIRVYECGCAPAIGSMCYEANALTWEGTRFSLFVWDLEDETTKDALLRHWKLQEEAGEYQDVSDPERIDGDDIRLTGENP